MCARTADVTGTRRCSSRLSGSAARTNSLAQLFADCIVSYLRVKRLSLTSQFTIKSGDSDIVLFAHDYEVRFNVCKY